MNKLILSLAGIGLLFSSCTRNKVDPSAHITSEVKSVSNFSELDISDSFTVYVSFSETEESVRIEANDNLHSYVIVEKNGSELEIRLKRNTSISGQYTLKVYISTSDLSAIDASGASAIYLRNTLNTNQLSLDLSGASHFSGELLVNRLYIDGSGASSFSLGGESNYLFGDLSGASSIEDYAFMVNQEIRANLSGASSCKLSVDGDLYIEGSGASTFYYRGNGIIKSQDLSGSSRLKKQ